MPGDQIELCCPHKHLRILRPAVRGCACMRACMRVCACVRVHLRGRVLRAHAHSALIKGAHLRCTNPTSVARKTQGA